MYNPKHTYKSLIGFCVFLFFSAEKFNAQIVIGSPNLGFTQACASTTFNTYSASFVFSPDTSLESSNQFTIELSDANGDFISATEIFTSNPGTVTASPATLNFSLPTSTAGENYKIRIKSSAPAATSASSFGFAAYYKIQDSPFTINNLVPNGVYCSSESYLLTIDNPGTGSNDSPLNYPNLTFKWYKETGPTTSIFVANGFSLNVNEVGTFFVETNYGTCTSNSFSNRVSISEATTGDSDAGISSSLGNPFCPDGELTTLTTIVGNAYQWYKNGNIIPEATLQMYQTSESGTYEVQVDLIDCMAAGDIELVSELFDASINALETNIIEDGEILSVAVTTSANNPEFVWYLDNVLIPAVSEDNYDATQFGTYKVIVTETTGCIGSREFVFELQEAFDAFPDIEKIPNVISPNGDGINDTWIIPISYVNGTNTNVMIMTSAGKVVLQTDNYLNNWPENNLNINTINQVFYYLITTSDNETKKGSITVIK